MLTTTAMNKLRTIGFNQADFQVIAQILSGTTDRAQTDVIDQKVDQSPGVELSDSEIVDLVGLQVRRARHPNPNRTRKAMTPSSALN